MAEDSGFVGYPSGITLKSYCIDTVVTHVDINLFIVHREVIQYVFISKNDERNFYELVKCTIFSSSIVHAFIKFETHLFCWEITKCYAIYLWKSSRFMKLKMLSFVKAERSWGRKPSRLLKDTLDWLLSSS